MLINLTNLMKVYLINVDDFTSFVIRFIFNMAVILVIVRGFYYPATKRKDFLFTYFLISATVFLLCIMLNSVTLQLGFALGLFAIFGIIRYRTAQIPIKEMTYLFIVIGLSVINALATKTLSYAEIIFANLAIIGIIWILEKAWLLRRESSKSIHYEKIELVKPENRRLLFDDLKERTGLNIFKIEIGEIDFLRDTARIKIYYYENDIILADDIYNLNN